MTDHRYYFYWNLASFLIAVPLAIASDAIDGGLEYFHWMIFVWVPVLILHAVIAFQLEQRVRESDLTYIAQDSVARPDLPDA